MLLTPADSIVSWHELPSEMSLIVQFAPPSLTVTGPVIVPALAEVTLTLTLIACPITDGSGVSAVIVVVVVAPLTVWLAVAPDPPNIASPE